MELIDSHCHLQFDAYHGHEDEVLARAKLADVKKVISVGTTLKDSEINLELASRKNNVWASVGAHPHDAAKFLADPNSAKKLKKLASQPKVVAVGETGLDYYRNFSDKADQKAALRIHIETALEENLPIIFHIRDAFEDFWPIFDSYKNIKGVVHSFSSHSGHLDEALRRGLSVGLNGIMTFTREQSQLEAAKAVPLERLLLETDAPFLTPAPYRGEVCEPKHIRTIAEFLAKLRGESLENLARSTTANTVKLFGLK